MFNNFPFDKADSDRPNKKKIPENLPSIMVFREVAEVGDRIGDIYWRPAWHTNGKKFLVVNFDQKWSQGLSHNIQQPRMEFLLKC